MYSKTIHHLRGFALAALPPVYFAFACGVFTAQSQTVHSLDDANAQSAAVKAAGVSVAQTVFAEAKAARAFKINPALQSAVSAHAGDRVDLLLFEGKNYAAEITSIVTDVNGTTALTLKLPDYPAGFAIITTDAGGKSLVSVSIPELGQSFGSRYATSGSSECYLIEIDETRMERPPVKNDAVTIPEGIPAMGGKNAANESASCGPVAGENTNSAATVSLLIVYTPAAAAASYVSQHGGINNVIASMIALGNTCLDNSQTGITLTLAHSEQVPYTENNNMDLSLERLQNPSDGYMDNVHALRGQYGANLVQLLTTDNDRGGIGYMLRNASGDYSSGFSACWVTQVADSYPCSVHEIGHNMGLGHGAQQTSVTAAGVFAYSNGWRWQGNQTNAYGNRMYASVMSYAGNYYGDGIPYSQYTPYFSNPNVSYMGAPTGDAARADAARSLREMKHVIAYYSERLNSLPSEPVNIQTSNPTNYGVTVTWNACASAVQYRVCTPDLENEGYYTYWTTAGTSRTLNSSSNFQPCNAYEIWIIAINECGAQTWSQTVTFNTACASCATPVVTVPSAGITPTSAVVDWTGGASRYEVQYKTAEKTAWTTLSPNPTANTATLSQLSSHTAYNVRVKALCGASLESAYSAVQTFTTTGSPANDNCANATALQCGAAAQGTLTLATPSTSVSSINYDDKNDVFYKFTAAAAGNYTVTLSNFGGDKDLMIYSGCGSTLELASSPTTLLAEKLTVSCAAGTAYIVRVIDYSDTGGAFNIKLDCLTSVTAPAVTTLAATNIAQTTATLNKSVTAGTETIQQRFLYRAEGASNWISTENANLTGLIAGVTYEFFAFAITANLAYYNGNMLKFTTHVPVTGVALNKTALTLAAGAAETLVATVAPVNASDKTVAWSSSNDAVAAVNNGVVTGVSAGSATITVTTQDGGKMATCTVVVENVTAAPELYVPDLKLYPNPFTDALHVAGAEGCTLRVFAESGAAVHTQKITGADETVNLEWLPAGSYLFRLEKDGQATTMKAIKN